MDDDRISRRADDDRISRRGDDSRPGPWRPFVKPGKIVVFKKPNWMLYIYLQMLPEILYQLIPSILWRVAGYFREKTQVSKDNLHFDC